MRHLFTMMIFIISSSFSGSYNSTDLSFSEQEMEMFITKKRKDDEGCGCGKARPHLPEKAIS